MATIASKGNSGAGGMGVVYSAYDTVLERKVAIKVVGDRVLADKTARDLLLHEARAASSLNHPNICTIHEVGDSDGEAYIVMEQVEGQPLSSLLGTNGLPPDSVVRYGMQIADALAHAHEHGVIHRDLKSTNAVVTPEGRVKVLDFGLAARLRDTELQEATSSKGPAHGIKNDCGHAALPRSGIAARRACRGADGHLGARGFTLRNGQRDPSLSRADRL